MRRTLRRIGVAAGLTLLAPLSAAGQETDGVIVVDQERLFEESRLGRRIAQSLEDRSNALAAENRAIEAELVAEERELTERRPDLSPDEFRSLADAFDAKVEALRAEQDEKARELVALRNAERQTFTGTVAPILLDFMRQNGAAVMLDLRSVVAAADRTDVTDELIEEIDAQVGDDGPGEAPGAEAGPSADDAPAD
jgi:Skp family chaperone for outer membrane proteins